MILFTYIHAYIHIYIHDVSYNKSEQNGILFNQLRVQSLKYMRVAPPTSEVSGLTLIAQVWPYTYS